MRLFDFGGRERHDLEATIYRLRDEIQLERKMKSVDLREQFVRHREAYNDSLREMRKTKEELMANLAASEAKLSALEKQLNDAPYEKLSQILKALVVKLPTVDLKSINIAKGE